HAVRVRGAWLFFFSSRRRHTRLQGDWSSDVCSSDLELAVAMEGGQRVPLQPSQVCGQTGVAPNNFRKYMEELQRCGLADMKGSKIGRASCREGVWGAVGAAAMS